MASLLQNGGQIPFIRRRVLPVGVISQNQKEETMNLSRDKAELAYTDAEAEVARVSKRFILVIVLMALIVCSTLGLIP